MKGGTPSHTEIFRFAMPHARVWGIVALLILYSVMVAEQAIGQPYGDASALLISNPERVQYPINKKASDKFDSTFLKHRSNSFTASPRKSLIGEGDTDTGRQLRKMSNASNVVFSEVLFRENRSGEWIELYNPTGQTIDLEGFEIEDSGVSIYFSKGYVMAPGSFFTIVKRSDRSDFEKVHGIQADFYTGGLENLNDRKGRVRLFNPDGKEIDMVAWDKSGYRDFNVGRGNSIIRVNPNIDTDTDNDWDKGAPEGEPGTQASANQSPVVSINGPYSGLAGQPVAFSSAGTSDPDGTIASYLWEFGDGETSISSNPNHSYASPGTYTVELTVTDNEGAQTTETTTVQVISNTLQWSGSENSDWENAGNWEGGAAPGTTPLKNIEIQSSGNNPVLESLLNISGVSLIIADGSDLTISSSGSLVIENDGIISTEASASLTLNYGSAYINKSVSDPFLVIERKITGSKGWRMISSPFALTFEDIFGGAFVTQGFTGSDYPELQPNLLSWDETDEGTTLQGWRTPGAITDIKPSGSGYFHYVFDGAGRPGSDLFYSDALPITTRLSGIEPNTSSGYTFGNLTFTPRDTEEQSGETDTVFIERNVADQGWNLIGNPTASTIDWDAPGWTKENISETIYVWDPNANGGAGDYLVWNGLNGNLQSGKISPLQAFWVKATGPSPVLSFDNEAKSVSGVFRGKDEPFINASNPDIPFIKFTLSASGYKKEIWLSFSDDGKWGYDKWDAYELQPMGEDWMSFYTSAIGNRSPGKVINHLPETLDEDPVFLNLILGLYENYQPGNSLFSLSWERSMSWPENLYVYLQDHETGSKYLIHSEADSIRFNHRSANLPELVAEKSGMRLNNALSLPSPGIVYSGDPDCDVKNCENSSIVGKSAGQRFSIQISRSSSDEYMPLEAELMQNYPNPFNPTTNLSFTLPEESEIKLQIFDLLGRKIATVADGVYRAGSHRFTWQAGSVSSGVYIYRLTVNGRAALTRKMTLLK